MSFKPRRGTLEGQTVIGDLDECQECGTVFNQAYQGYYVDEVDLGSDPDGAVGRLFKRESEKFGNEWGRFKEKDLGPWCDSCSWIVQRWREITDGEFSE